MKLKHIISSLFLTILLILPNTSVQSEIKEEIHWVSIEEALQMAKIHNKMIIVDIYTNWCGWCKIMDQRTYQNAQIISYINQKFYAVKLNAERKDTVKFQGNQFIYETEKRMHQLASLLLNNKPQYPSTVFLTSKAEVLPAIFGYIDNKTMIKILNYYGEGEYLNSKWKDYEKEYDLKEKEKEKK